MGGGFGFFEYVKIGFLMFICGIFYFLIIGYCFLLNNVIGGEVGSVGV